MGRLTLNILLSFAQFEREVIGERIRDKVAASRKKGIWMGGPVPLGYNVKDRKLIVDPAEAETVRTIFTLYARSSSTAQVIRELDARAILTKTGRPYDKTSLLKTLHNSPIVRPTVDEVAQKDDLSIRFRMGPSERASPPSQPSEGSLEFGGLAVGVWNDVKWFHAVILGLFSVSGLAQPPHRSEAIRGS
jgi:hypothetical protein